MSLLFLVSALLSEQHGAARSFSVTCPLTTRTGKQLAVVPEDAWPGRGSQGGIGTRWDRSLTLLFASPGM